MTEVRNDSASPEAQERFKILARQPLRKVAPDPGFFSGMATSLHDIYDHRHLWLLLTKRELKARYKDSVLGFVWTLVRPLVNLLIYTVVIGEILGASRGIHYFAVYVFAGLTAWGLFSQMVAAATGSIVGNSGIVKKVYLPREIFPLSAAGASFVDFLAQMAILLCGAFLLNGTSSDNALYFNGFDLKLALIYFPISLAVIIVWGLACGLVLSALNVYLRDIQYLVEVVLMVGFWMTPSVYAFDMVQRTAGQHVFLSELYASNPMALAVMGFQQAFWNPHEVHMLPSHMLWRLVVVFLIGLVLVFVAQRCFARLQRNFAQEL